METDQSDLLIVISSFLTQHKISYMLTGALSVVYYGCPRASHDIDFVVEINKSDTQKVLDAFKKLSTEYLIHQGAVEEAIDKKRMFNIIYLPSFTKLDFWLLTDDWFDKERFKRRRRVKLLGRPMMIASPEDTIIQKLRWYKKSKIEKHLVDAAFVYQIQKQDLDNGYLEKWFRRLKLTHFFEQLRKIKLEQYI